MGTPRMVPMDGFEQLEVALERAKVELAVQHAEICQLRLEKRALLRELAARGSTHPGGTDATELKRDPTIERDLPNVAQVLKTPRMRCGGNAIDSERHGWSSKSRKTLEAEERQSATQSGRAGSPWSPELDDVNLTESVDASTPQKQIPELALSSAKQRLTQSVESWSHRSRLRERNPGIPRSLGREFTKYKARSAQQYAQQCAELDELADFFSSATKTEPLSMSVACYSQ